VVVILTTADQCGQNPDVVWDIDSFVFVIVPGLMEHEAIPNISSSRRIGGKSGGGAKPGSSQKAKAITVSTIIKEVSN